MSDDIEIKRLDELLKVCDRLIADDWIKSALREAIPKLGQLNKQQADLVAQLPYSPAYVGKKKPSGLRRAGGEGDIGYARDTLALLSDLLFSWDLDALQLTNFSDLAYAGYQASLAEEKGVSFYADDELYYGAIDQSLGDAAESLWGAP